MEVCCLSGFKLEYEKLKKNKSYKKIEAEIIENFFYKKSEDFFSNGRKLTGTNDIPFIKKRISGSGGWRFYYLLFIKNNILYLAFLHPKTGSDQLANIGEEYEKFLYNEVLVSIKGSDYFHVSVDNSGSLVFTHVNDKVST